MPIPRILPETIRDYKWCPGCGHGVFVRLMQEVLSEKGLTEHNVCIVGVGCSANIHAAVRGGNKVEAHHGRATATARGMKAVLPEACVWTYQGDGDAYAIGLGETMLAAHNGYPISVFVVNNLNYGMTGGQSAPTTLVGQATATAPDGSSAVPFDAMPHIAGMKNVAYAARGTTVTAAEVRKLKGYIARAIDAQMKEGRYAFVELLCPCPTNWHKTPREARDFVLAEAVRTFPLGEFKTAEGAEDDL